MSTRIRALRFLPSFDASQQPRRRRRRKAPDLIGWLMLGAAIVTMPASSQTLLGSVIAGGGGRSASAGGCLRLDATIAQPLASVASGGIYIVTSGFLPGRGDNESIFHYGFEVCS